MEKLETISKPPNIGGRLLRIAFNVAFRFSNYLPFIKYEQNFELVIGKASKCQK